MINQIDNVFTGTYFCRLCKILLQIILVVEFLLEYLVQSAKVSIKKQLEVCLKNKCGPIQAYFQTKGLFCIHSLADLIHP